MQTFKIRPESFGDIRKKALLKMIPAFCGIIVFATVVNFVNGNAEQTTDIGSIIIPVLVSMALCVLGVLLGLKRYFDLLKSYTIVIDNSSITREQKNTPVVSINFIEIKEIIKNANHSFLIKSTSSGNMIAVPPQIENYKELEQMLNQIMPVTEKTKQPLYQKYSIVFSLAGLALMLVIYTVQNKIIVATGGTLLVGFLIWSLIQTQRSKQIDNTTKRSSWAALLVLASVIGVMIVKLTA